MMDHFCEAQANLSSLPTAGDIYHQQPAHQANIAAIANLVAQRLLDDQAILQDSYTRTKASPPNDLTDMAISLQHQETIFRLMKPP
jgi:hypothetical protein